MLVRTPPETSAASLKNQSEFPSLTGSEKSFSYSSCRGLTTPPAEVVSSVIPSSNTNVFGASVADSSVCAVSRSDSVSVVTSGRVSSVAEVCCGLFGVRLHALHTSRQINTTIIPNTHTAYRFSFCNFLMKKPSSVSDFKQGFPAIGIID